MQRILLFLLICVYALPVAAQPPASYSSAEILQKLKKLQVLGSVLYIAAHPDDENTRLLAYLANERLYRTGYLSLTRGDGGQNLIGDEQGIDLGLIRTQELLAARRVDGAEQFFSTAYDFGFCKSPEEALRTWNHDKILAEVVWVIRKFQPDVIITRFPTTGEGGHGHHTASAILAGEAFDAAADPKQFPEQFNWGVKPWQAKRLLWNTFNFGSTNTQKEDQFKLNVGQFNPLLGKSYGELAAISRSQHKSQGFGVPSQRGNQLEYFASIKGPAPQTDLLEGVDTRWSRTQQSDIIEQVAMIIRDYDLQHPEQSVPALLDLHQHLSNLAPGYWVAQKQQEIAGLILACSGFYAEAVTDRQLNVVGDSLRVTVTVNKRLPSDIQVKQFSLLDQHWNPDSLRVNENSSKRMTLFIPANTALSQPYWLEQGLSNGSFAVTDGKRIGPAINENLEGTLTIQSGSRSFRVSVPVRYKYTDPVKGERFMPVEFIPALTVEASPSLLLFTNDHKKEIKPVHFSIQANRRLMGKISPQAFDNRKDYPLAVMDSLAAGEKRIVDFPMEAAMLDKNSSESVGMRVQIPETTDAQYQAIRKITYDHIPDIFYHFVDKVSVIRIDLAVKGKRVGYIAGAGDKIPEALEQMGYEVVRLNASDIEPDALRNLDAIVTGVRAYNIHDWLTEKYDVLMQYVSNGGILLVQYNTNNSIGPVKARIAPYPFVISRNRVTNELAPVHFLQPDHRVLHYPNEITAGDFDGWVQERSIYHAEQLDAHYQTILGFADPGEKEQDGSLIISDYGKGRFVYTGLALFRQLPAGVPGAYRLLANLLAK